MQGIDLFLPIDVYAVWMSSFDLIIFQSSDEIMVKKFRQAKTLVFWSTNNLFFVIMTYLKEKSEKLYFTLLLIK
ncbi:MAG: hypothetical protein IPI04_18285 [Ignavibacteria bacterium]|nr:hypothetical protein [Ignavibacteria bacterium]